MEQGKPGHNLIIYQPTVTLQTKYSPVAISERHEDEHEDHFSDLVGYCGG